MVYVNQKLLNVKNKENVKLLKEQFIVNVMH